MKSFEEIVKLIEDARNNALKKVNEELITLYWKTGQYISRMGRGHPRSVGRVNRIILK